MRNSLLARFAAILASLAALPSAHAATDIWDNGTSGAVFEQSGTFTWVSGDAKFWNGTADVAPATGDFAQFGNGGTPASAPLINLGNQSVRGLIFGPTTTFGYTLSATSTGTLTIGSGGIAMNSGAQATSVGSSNLQIALGANQTWVNNASMGLYVNGIISGTGVTLNVLGGTASGAFTWFNNSASTYSGTTNILGGFVFGSPHSPFGSSTINVASGAQLAFGNYSYIGNAIILNGGTGPAGSDGGTLKLIGYSLFGTTTLAAGDTTIANDLGAQHGLLSKVTGPGALTIGGTNEGNSQVDVIQLTSTSSDWSGGLTISRTVGSPGTVQILQLSNSNVIPNSLSVNFKNGAYSVLDLSGNRESIDLLNSNAAGDGMVINSSTNAAILTLGSGTAAGATFSGNLSSNSSVAIVNSIITTGGTGGALSVVKTGSGTQVLSGSNSYAGTTSLNGGILNLGSAYALSGGGPIVFGGGTLQYSGSNNADFSGQIVGSGSAISIDTNGQNVTYASNLVLSNSGGLTKLGTGTLTLTGSNAYGGVTSINGGTLCVGANALSGGGGLVFGGGMLRYAVGNLLDYSGRVIGGTGAILVDTNGQNIAFASALGSANTGGLTKSGAGMLTLSASNAFTGTTNLNAGILNLGNPGALAGGGSLVFTGGTLQYSAVNSVDYSGRIVGSGSVISIDTNGQNVLFAASLAGSNTGGLVKLGSGTLTLSAPNAFSGNTAVYAGTLILSNSLVCQNSTVTTGGAGLVFDASVAGHSFTLGALSGSANLALTDNAGNPVALTLAGDNGLLGYSGVLTGAGSLTLTGTGTRVLSGSNSYTGTTAITGGVLILNGLVSGPINLSGGTLQGSGTTGSLTFSGGIDAPSVGSSPTVVSGSYTLGSAAVLQVQLSPGAPGVAYSQIVVSSSISLAGSLQVLAPFGMSAGTSFTILRNLANQPILGIFAGLPEGTIFAGAGYNWSVTYLGGAGHDIVLTIVAGANSIWDNGTVGATFDATGNFTWAPGDQKFCMFYNHAVDVAPTANDVVQFGNGGTLASSPAINLGNQTIGGLVFAATTTSGYTLSATASAVLTIGNFGITMNSGAQAASVGSSNLGIALGANQTWTNNSSTELNVSGAISGIGVTLNVLGGTASGAFTWFNNTASTYSGTTNILSGFVKCSPHSPFGSSTINVTSGAQLVFDNYSYINNAIILNGGTGPAGSDGGTLKLVGYSLFGTTTLAAGDTTIANDLGAQRGLLSKVTGPGALTIGGTNEGNSQVDVIRLTSTASDWSGGLTISRTVGSPGTVQILQLAYSGVIPDALSIKFKNGAYSVLDLNGRNETVDLLLSSTNGDGMVINSSTNVGTLTIGGGTTTSGTFSGNLSSVSTFGIISGTITATGTGAALSLTKTGTGTQVLTGSNSNAGTTSFNGGILNLGSAYAMAGGGPIAFGGGTLQYSASNAVDFSALIANSGGPISIDTNGRDVTFASPIEGSNTGGLIKLGAGSLTLSASNAFGGSIAVTGGTLILTNAAALQNGTLTTGGAGLVFASSVTGHAFTLGGLGGGGNLALADNGSNAINLTVGCNNANATYSGILSGTSVTITKVGTGTLMLAGNCTYIGSTVVTAGSLAFNALINGPITVSGGTLAGSGTAMGSVNVGAGVHAPSVGTSPMIINGAYSLGASAVLQVQLNSGTAGIGYSQIVANSSVSLAGSLSIQALSGLSAGTAFTLLRNVSNQPISGTFIGLPEGSIFTSNGYIWSITYLGGTGHDVVLTLLPDYDSWKSAYFSPDQLNTFKVGGDTASPAGDGIANLAKYAFGLNPWISATPVATAGVQNGYLSITYPQVKSAIDVTYIVEVSSDLITWNFGSAFTTPVSSVDAGTVNLITVRDNVPIAGTPRRFIRVRVTEVGTGVESSVPWPQGPAFPLFMYEAVDTGTLVSYGWNIMQGYGINGTSEINSSLQNWAVDNAYGTASLPAGSGAGFEWTQSQIQAWIQAVSGNANLAWWNLPEELQPWNSVNRQLLADYTAWSRLYDPLRRPTYEVMEASFNATSVGLFAMDFDIVAAECYCVAYDFPHAWVRYTMEQACLGGIARAGATVGKDYVGGQKTPLSVLQCTVSGTRYATPAQSYHDFWSAIASGAMGIGVFAEWHMLYDSPSLTANLAQLNLAASQITGPERLGTVILNGIADPTVVFNVTSGPTQTVSFIPTEESVPFQYPSINVLCKIWNGTAYVIAVNSTDSSVTATISNLPTVESQASLPFESRSVTVTAGAFSDTFPAWGVHIYKMPASRIIDGH